MKMNKILCLLLVLILVLSLGQSAFASGNATVLIEPVKEVKLLTVKEAADQLKLIASNFKQLKQDDSSFEWKYAVTDLDHDGQLELVAAAMHPEDRSTNFKVFELSEKLDHFVSCNVKLEEGESFHYIHVFLNDLARGKDIEWSDVLDILKEILQGKHGKIDCSFPCYY